MRLYVVDYEAARDSPQITAALKDAFAGSEPPACTWVAVSGLANEGFLIEVEAMAVVEGEG